MVIARSYCFLSVSFRSLKSQTGLEEQSGKEGMTVPDLQSHSLPTSQTHSGFSVYVSEGMYSVSNTL